MSIRGRLLAWYVRLPEHPTKLRVVRWLGRHVFPQDGIRARAYPDLELYLHPRDWIEYLLLRGDRYEPLTLGFLTANLRAGDSALLAGVNFGQHVAVAARAVGTSGTVVGVEPQPAAIVRALSNLRLNRLDAQVKLVNVALGSREEFVPMASSQAVNTGLASLFHSGSGFVVRVVPVSQVIDGVSLRVPKLMLLDVQGYETYALAGLGEHRPDIIVVEFDPTFMTMAGVTADQLLAAMTERGYQVSTLHGTPIASIDDLPEQNMVGVQPGVQVTWV